MQTDPSIIGRKKFSSYLAIARTTHREDFIITNLAQTWLESWFYLKLTGISGLCQALYTIIFFNNVAVDLVNFHWLGKRSVVSETSQQSCEISDVSRTEKRKILLREGIILPRCNIVAAILNKTRSQWRRSLLRCEYP